MRTYFQFHQQDNVILTLDSPFVKLDRRINRVIVRDFLIRLVSRRFEMLGCGVAENERVVVMLTRIEVLLDRALTDESKVCCVEKTSSRVNDQRQSQRIKFEVGDGEVEDCVRATRG
jgi:hypothetical protein